MHEKSEIDENSSTGFTSTSSASPNCNYIVQSPSRDSQDDKSSSNSQTTPTDSPSHFSHSRMSSESRVSGPYRFSLIGKHNHNFLKRKKGWSTPLFSVIDEENDDYGNDDYYHDKYFIRQFRVLLFLMGFVMVFAAVCLITWGASRPYKFQLHMKNWKMNTFYYGQGSDNTGVPTKFLTINCTVKMKVHNPASFFGIHVTSSPLNLLYSQVIIGSGQFGSYYQPKKSQRTMSVNVEGRKIPLYGVGMDLVMANNNGRVPLKLEFEIRSHANLIGRLVKTKHHHRVLCTMEINSENNNVFNFNQDSCSIS